MTSEQLYEALGEIDDNDIQDAHQPVRRRRIRHWAALAACLALVLAAGVWWNWNHGSGSESAPAEDAADGSAALPSTGDVGDLSDGNCIPGEPEEDSFKTELVCNDARLAPAAMNLYELDAADFVPMSRGELLDYYQAELPMEDLFPELKQIPAQETWGIYRRDQGSGAVYYDAICLAYTDGVRRVELTLSRASHAFQVLPEPVEKGKLEPTQVNGRQLYVFRDGNQLYTSWMEGQTGWQLLTTGLSEADFSLLLSQMVTPGDDTDLRTQEGEPIAIDPQARRLALKAADGTILGVRLPEDLEPEEYRLSDRVRVEWRGEPATLGTVWAGQLENIESLEGAEEP